jgi:hypothetical protein
MGRLTAVAADQDRWGHSVQARRGALVLSRSVTDGAGRFLLEWGDAGEGEDVQVELLNEDGRAVESARVGAADLSSPPVISLSGKGVRSRAREVVDGELDSFRAYGDFPLCVTSSCQEVTLTWSSPPGSTVSIHSEKGPVRERLPARGSLKVFEKGSRTYARRALLSGTREVRVSELTVEVRRYPVLSLVLDGARFEIGREIEIGASISCLAGERGVVVTVLSSDESMFPQTELIIPPGAQWTTKRVRVGVKAGRVDAMAMAPGFVRDGVTFQIG